MKLIIKQYHSLPDLKTQKKYEIKGFIAKEAFKQSKGDFIGKESILINDIFL